MSNAPPSNLSYIIELYSLLANVIQSINNISANSLPFGGMTFVLFKTKNVYIYASLKAPNHFVQLSLSCIFA